MFRSLCAEFVTLFVVSLSFIRGFMAFVHLRLSACPSVTPLSQHLTYYRRCALLFFKFIHKMSNATTPIWTIIERFRTVTPVWTNPWLWNDAQILMQYRRGALLFSKVIHQISWSPGLQNWRFGSNLITRTVAAIKSLRFALFVLFQS